MTSQIINAHEKADEFIRDITARAAEIGVEIVIPVQPHLDRKVDFSTNRYQQRSAYFTIQIFNNNRMMLRWDCRVSDHMSQWSTAGLLISAHDIKTPADNLIARIKSKLLDN